MTELKQFCEITLAKRVASQTFTEKGKNRKIRESFSRKSFSDYLISNLTQVGLIFNLAMLEFGGTL